MVTPPETLRWGITSVSDRNVIMWRDCQPWLFRTRREAREARDQEYGYIRHRPDLRAAPHRWRLPDVVRVKVSIRRVS